jgi:four helix bundle protein
VEIYRISAHCSDRGYRDQIGRSALSIPSNIAEGYERESSAERIRFLKIAKGSCGELWTQLLIGREAGFLAADDAKRCTAEVRELAGMLHGLIQYFASGDRRKSSKPATRN